jgi:hypothetical protein
LIRVCGRTLPVLVAPIDRGGHSRFVEIVDEIVRPGAENLACRAGPAPLDHGAARSAAARGSRPRGSSDCRGRANSGDTAWMLTSVALVLLMTIPGLALFYGAMVHKMSVLAVSWIGGQGKSGLIDGNPHQVIVQLYAVIVVVLYDVIASPILLKLVDLTIGLRVGWGNRTRRFRPLGLKARRLSDGRAVLFLKRRA